MDYKEIIMKKYNLIVTTIDLIESHFGTEIYHITTDSDKYILKVYPLYMESAKNEGYVVEFLLNNNLKVSCFLKTCDDEYSVTTAKGIITIQKYIEGTTLSINSAPDWFIEKSAQLLGRINSVFSFYSGFPTKFGANFFLAKNAIKKKEQYENELLIAKKKNDKNIISLYEEQIRHLSRISKFCININKLTYANSHGDYHIGQAIVDGKEITIIDWASACKLPVCLEVITSFVFASPKCKDGLINAVDLKRYIKNYCKYYTLSEYDISTMPYVLYFWHCICNYSPQEEIPNNYKPIAMLIQNMLNWLFHNVDVLSEELHAL